MARRFWIALTGGGAVLVLCALFLAGSAMAQEDGEGGSVTDWGQRFIDRLAGNLGVTSDELDSAIDQTGNELIDEAVENGEITEEQAERLRERIDAHGIWPRLGGPHGHRWEHGIPVFSIGHNILETVADELEMTEVELLAELRDGATLEEIIEEHGSSVEVVVDALVLNAEARLDEAIANGRLSQERADEIRANLPERITSIIENGIFCRPLDDHDTDGEHEETSNTSTLLSASLWG